MLKFYFSISEEICMDDTDQIDRHHEFNSTGFEDLEGLRIPVLIEHTGQ